MKLLLTLAIYLPLGISQVDIVTNLIERIIYTEQIKNIVIVSSEEDPFDYFQRSALIKTPYIIFNQEEAGNFNTDLKPVLRRKLFSIVCCDIEKDTWRKTGLVLKTFHSETILFIDENNSTIQKKFFKWCWQHGFLDVLLWSNSTQNLFRYEQFPNFRIITIQDSVNEELFNSKNQLKNINGYPVKTPIFNNPPRVIKYFNYNINKTVIGGYSYYLLDAFVKSVNGRLIELHLPKYNVLDFTERIIAREIDICVHPHINDIKMALSYPIYTVKWQLMVPVQGELDPYFYFILPFKHKVWLAIMWTFCYISVSMSLIQLVVTGKIKLAKCMCEVLLNILSMPLETFKRNETITIMVFKFQVLLFAFIINNLYHAHLKTYMTTDLIINTIDSLEELRKSGTKILCSYIESTYYIHHLDLDKDLLMIASEEELHHQKNTLKNSSYAYMITEDKYWFYSKQFEKLSRPIFTLVKDSLAFFQLGLSMPTDSPFLLPFNDFLMRVHQSGFILKWEQEGVNSGILSGDLDVRHFEDHLSYRPLKVADLKFAWLCLTVGCGSAALVFSVSWLMYFILKCFNYIKNK